MYKKNAVTTQEHVMTAHTSKTCLLSGIGKTILACVRLTSFGHDNYERDNTKHDDNCMNNRVCIVEYLL